GEQVIVLGPRLDQLAIRVDDEDAVAQFGRRGGRLLAERAPGSVEGRRQFFGKLQLASIEEENSVGRLGEHAALRALHVAGASERLSSVRDHLVGTSFFFAALLGGSGARLQAEGEYDCGCELTH